MKRLVAAGIVAGVAMLGWPAVAQDDVPLVTIGFLDIEEDIRYEDWGVHPVDIRSETAFGERRAYAGAQLALSELERLRRVAKAEFALQKKTVADAPAMVEAITRMHDDGISFFVLDASSTVIAEVATFTADMGVYLFNTTAIADELRNEFCEPHLFHTAASRAMLTDAVAQYLKAQKWDDVLVLRGPLAEDHLMVAAFERSADLFNLDIDEVRDFVLGNDPRARETNDLAFLTGRASYDAVFVADIDGEFALGVPYATLDPAAVVGASGLVPRVWHWSYLRHGAPQVHGRFERMHGRRMGEADWGAWIALKVIGNGMARAKSTDPAAVAEVLRGGRFRIDGSKGPGMGFRTWDNQLRQPIMLTTDNWVTARAPIEGFEHRTNDLDTLGTDERDSSCKF